MSDPSPAREMADRARSAVDSVAQSARQLADDVQYTFRKDSSAPGGAAGPALLDPVRFKRILVGLFKVLVVVELFDALLQGINSGAWARFGIDLVIVGTLYVGWERIRGMIREAKATSREQIERSPHNVRLWNALAFSLLWSDEIYSEIPADRRRLVVISYTLIALGLLASFFKFGAGLMPLVLAGALVLGAANLVVWVVSRERGQRESLQTELDLAQDVQRSLMPKAHPVLPGMEIAGISIPAREVGGDLFDYSCVGGDENLIGISVMDVSGKGLQAALSATFTVGALASEVRASDSPAVILTRLNRVLCRHSRRGQFVAFVLVVLDRRRGKAVFTNAGQTKPLMRRADGVRWLDPVGAHFPLGMRAETEYEEGTIPLVPGDILLLLSDGFTDAMNNRKEMFSTERLEAVLREDRIASMSAQEILDHILQHVRSHIGDAAQHDDMTMVVMRVTPLPDNHNTGA